MSEALAAEFSNSIEISGNLDISGDINIQGNLVIDGSLNLYGYDVPDPTGLSDKVLTISGDDGYVWATVSSNSQETGEGDEIINDSDQTFYDIITQQPKTFEQGETTDNTHFDNTIDTIDISWSFDKLIPNEETNKHLNIDGDLRTRVLPCITKICFDISSSANSALVNTTYSIDVATSDNYNVDVPTAETGSITDSYGTDIDYTLLYKSLNLKVSGQNVITYDVRVWGLNESNESAENKLSFDGLIFRPTGIPATPTIDNITSSISSNIITLHVNVETDDLDISSADTELISSIYVSKVDLSFSRIDSLASSSVTLQDHSGFESITKSFSDNETTTSSGGDDIVDLSASYTASNELYLGAKYRGQVRIYNPLNVNSTDYSSTFDSDYTDIPSSAVNNLTDPFNNTTLSNKYSKTILTSTGHSTINLYLLDIHEDSNSSYIRMTNNNRILPLTNYDATLSDYAGYGKYIDGSKNIISIYCILNRDGVNSGNDVSLQQINFNGWGDAPDEYIHNNSSKNIVGFTNEEIYDLYDGNNNMEGFHLIGEFDRSNIEIGELYDEGLITPFAPDSNTGYKITFEMDPHVGGGYHTDYNSTRTEVSSTFFVDSFANYNSPSYSTTSSSITLDSIEWVMGIPNASTASLATSRTHTNINSQYKYIHSSDSSTTANIAKVTKVQTDDAASSNQNLSTSTSWYLTKTYAALDTDGEYTGDYNYSIDYSSLNAFSNNNITGIKTTTTVYNLYTNSGSVAETYSIGSGGHYRDVESISNKSNINNIYEIDDPTYLANDEQFANITLSEYTDHTSEIKKRTAAFINGKFDGSLNNYTFITTDYNWSTLSGSYGNILYEKRDHRIKLGNYSDVTTTNSSGGDYKSIVYKLDTSESGEYNKLGDNTTYIDITVIVDKLFGPSAAKSISENIMSYSSSNTYDDLLCFIVGEFSNETYKYLGIVNDGAFNTTYDGTAKWFESNLLSNNSFYDLTLLGFTSAKSGGGCRLNDTNTNPLASTVLNTGTTNAGLSSTYTSSDGTSLSRSIVLSSADLFDNDKSYLYFFVK